MQTRHDNGFTLFETIIVLVIVAILTALAVMSIGNSNQTHKLPAVADQLIATLHAASSEALLKPAIIGLKFDDNGFSAFQFVRDKDGYKWKPLSVGVLNNTSAFNDVDINIKKHGQQFALAKLADDTPQLIILPSGDMNPITITLSNQHGKRSIKVLANGEIKLL